MLLESLDAYHFLLDFVVYVLVAFQGNFREDGRCATVVLADEVAGHGPQVNETLSELVLERSKVVGDDDAVGDGFEAGKLLSNVGTV